MTNELLDLERYIEEAAQDGTQPLSTAYLTTQHTCPMQLGEVRDIVTIAQGRQTQSNQSSHPLAESVVLRPVQTYGRLRLRPSAKKQH